MSRRTVLHLIHTGGAGGAETVMLQLVQHLDRAVWRSIAGVPGDGWLLSALRETEAEVAVLPSSGPFDARLLYRLIRIVRSRRIDLIHTHLFGPAVYASVVARMFGLPVVSTIHGAVDLAVAHKWAGLKTRLLRRPHTTLVAVTEALREQVVRELRVGPGQVRVIRNGIDLSRFHPSPHDGLREELGWTRDEIVIGALGNVRRPKGYEYLLEAARILLERCPRCRFVIIGDTAGEPSLYSDLLARREALGVEQSVAFVGFHDDVNAALNSLDLFAMSSTREGLPLAVLQAMAVKLPIVATRCGGPQEVLTDGKDAVLVPVADPPALAAALHGLAEDRTQRARLGAAALNTVRSRYSLSRMAAEYDRLYRGSLEPSGWPSTNGVPS